MQLKNLGNSVNAVQSIGNIINKFEAIPKNLGWSKNLSNELVDATKGYSTEVLKLAIAQTTLDETQIKAILTAKGLKGEILETTTAELAQTTATNTLSASETTATAATGGLSAAFKGLGASIKSTLVSIKSFIIANPALVIASVATAAIAAGAALYNKFNPPLKKATENLKEQKRAFDDVSKEISDLSKELDTANERLTELQSKGSLSLIENEELVKLKETTAELETQLAIKKEEQRLEAKKTADAAEKAFNGGFVSMYDDNGDMNPYSNGGFHSTDSVRELENSIKAYYKLQEEYKKAKENADFFIKESERNGGRYSETGKVDYKQYEKYTKQMDTLEKQMNTASTQAKTMYEAINGQKEAYEGLADAGYTLNLEQLKEYQTVRQSSDAYRNFCADINDTAKSFEELDNAQKRSSLEAEFILKGLDDKKAKEIVESIDDEDLDITAKLTAQFDSNSTKESVRNAIELARSEAQGIANETEISIDFDQAWADSFTSENDAVKGLGDSLLELAEQGRLTIETFNETDFTDYFKNLGISADEAVSKINKLVDESKQLSSMSSQISSMADALGTKQENGFVEADTLAGFDVEVRGLESWDRFQEVLGSTTSSYEECQEAANALATEWVNSSDFLAQLTEQNREYYATQLEAMGIENYEEVISYAMALNDAKEVLSQSSLMLGEATQDEIEALIAEGTYSELTANMILALYDAKIAEQAATLDTSADCANLIALAGDTDRTSKSIELLIQLMNIYNGLESGVYDNNEYARTGALAVVTGIKAQLEAIANGETAKMEIEPTVRLGNRGKSSAKSAGKEAGKSYKDGLKEELSDLEGILSSLSKAIDGQKEIISSQKEAALESIESQISALEEERDARLEVIDVQKKQLENEIKAIDKKIDAKQKEIKAINDAAKSREHELQLQKSLYELERMQNQRTILQYSEDKGMHYVADESGIRDAKEDVDAAKRQLDIDAIEREIDLLEESKDLLNEKIDLLDEQADSINKFYDSQIKSLEKQKESTEKYFESLIKSIENSKSKYQELLDIVDRAELSGKLKKLGIDEEALLNGSEEEFEKLKNAYLDVVFQVNEGNEEMLSSLRELSGYEGTAPAMLADTTEKLDEVNEQLDSSTQSMDKFSDSATAAGEGTSAVAENMSELGTSTEGISDNLTSINDALNDLPESDKLDDLATKFTNLGEAIQSVADVLGVGEEGAVSTLVGALQEISTISLDGGGSGEEGAEGSGGGIITQFNNLKTAVEDVTNAISGSGSSGGQEGDASGSSSPSMSSGADGEGTNGLIGAIGEIKPATDEALGGGGESEESEGEGSGAIPQFQELKTAVDEVTAAIGTADSEGGEGTGGEGAESTTLIGALRAQYETASETIPETKALFEELLESIMSCVGALNTMVSLIGSMADVGGGFGGSGISIIPHAEGTVGNAFANGTKYKGLANREKNALVSEYGQPEMTVLPNGKTVLTDKPTMMDLPKDTVIFNEEQTKKIMDNKVDLEDNAYASGTALANGSADDGTIVLEDGTVLRPLQPGDKMYDMVQKFDAYFKSINGNIEKLVPNSYYEHNRQMDQMVRDITNISNISNNNKPSVNIGDIHVTCPGVTSQEVMREVGDALGKQIGHLAQRAMQEQPRRY